MFSLDYTAPTNDAFAALDAGTVDSLLLPENKDKLIKILQYHVVAANADSSVASGDYPTLSGDNIKVENSDSGVMINDANVIIPYDVIASNGIIHAIDKVLMPPTAPTASIYEIASGAGNFSTLGESLFAI